MITGLASAQAQYDSMEPASFTMAEEDRIDALVVKGCATIRRIIAEDVADFLDDVWSPDDSDAIRDAVKDAVLEEIAGALG